MPTKTPSTVNDCVAEFNKRHAAILMGGKFMVLSEFWNHTLDRPEYRFSRLEDIKKLYQNAPIMVRDEKGNEHPVNPATLWMNSANRRQYIDIAFDPSEKVPDNIFNLWRGFAIKPKKGRCALFKEHIRRVVCAGDPALAHWLMDWIAAMIQQPGGQRCGTSVVLRGMQGTGKGVFANNLGAIFGNHYVHITGQQRLTGRFNNHLKDALLVFVDEGFWAGDRRDSGSLKAMVTEDILMVEPKGVDAFPVRNHMRLIMASNNTWIVPAGLEERRFCVIDVADTHRGDHGYFTSLVAELDKGGREAFLWEMQRRKIDSNLREIPRTNALFDQIIHSLGTVGQWWFERLDDGFIGDESGGWPQWRVTQHMYQHYRTFCDDVKERHPRPNHIFVKRLKIYCPEIGHSRRLVDPAGGQKQGLTLPTLTDARRAFEQRVNMTVPWTQYDPDNQG